LRGKEGIHKSNEKKMKIYGDKRTFDEFDSQIKARKFSTPTVKIERANTGIENLKWK